MRKRSAKLSLVGVAGADFHRSEEEQMEMNMTKIYPAVACLMLALAYTQSLPAVAQSRIPPGPMPSIPPLTPQFNNPGPQFVPTPPPTATLPTDPPMGPLGIR
jgi:hypothetical protein